MSLMQSQPFSVTYKEGPADSHVCSSAYPTLPDSYSQTPGCLRAFARACFPHLEHLCVWTTPLSASELSLNVTSLGRPSLIPSLGQGPATCFPDLPALAGFPAKRGLRLAGSLSVKQPRRERKCKGE